MALNPHYSNNPTDLSWMKVMNDVMFNMLLPQEGEV